MPQNQSWLLGKATSLLREAQGGLALFRSRRSPMGIAWTWWPTTGSFWSARPPFLFHTPLKEESHQLFFHLLWREILEAIAFLRWKTRQKLLQFLRRWRAPEEHRSE